MVNWSEEKLKNMGLFPVSGSFSFNTLTPQVMRSWRKGKE